MKKYFAFFIVILLAAYVFFLSGAALAATGSGGDNFFQGLKQTGETGAGYPDAAATNPANFLSKMLGLGLTPMFMGVSGMLSLIYGGYKWMMSRGNEQEAELAKTIIINTLLAMIIAFSAYGIVTLIIPLWRTTIAA